MTTDGPLRSLDEWDEDVRRRYARAEADPKTGGEVDLGGRAEAAGFRDYGAGVRPEVREFYRQNHAQQTVAFARAARDKYLPLRNRRMGVWEAMEQLERIVDDSDPDIELPQIAHAIQTAEAIRADGHPSWFVVTGLIHDLGKVLCLFGEPQWAVTGDTFPVGCRHSPKIVFHEFFAENPDLRVPEYQTECGMYDPGCGLDRVLMSWGHDEYLYHVVRDHLPIEALYMIRYHSFYPAHREGEYAHLMDDRDRELFRWVHAFNPYDLYTKSDTRPDLDRLLPYYRDLVDEFFPATLMW